jgi:gliding motility-associated-like protein
MKRISISIVLFLAMVSTKTASGQTNNPYHLNGSARQDNCNCYTITTANTFQSGSIWNINKISLNQSFDFKFNVYLGCIDANGADGIVFVLQPISTSVGSSGEGLGFAGVSPSIGIPIDTWLNDNLNDPDYDHISIHKNGDNNHLSANNLAGPVPALASSYNIEDCAWHVLRIVWDASSKTLEAFIDNVSRVKVTLDLVNAVFNGDPNVFWGFTGATGGAVNDQRICTSLNPLYSFPAGQQTCYPTPIEFIDSSTSFGSIVKWFWDFGDGTIDSVATPQPHVFPAPGKYDVSLRILGNNGCLSDPYIKTVIAGSEPVADFLIRPGIICQNDPISFEDMSSVEFGTINKWNWEIADKTFVARNPLAVQFDVPGTVNASLSVETAEGCKSQIATKTFQSLPKAQVDFDFEDICANETAFFEAMHLNSNDVSVREYYWNSGNGRLDSSATANFTYTKGGTYPVALSAVASNGCVTQAVTKPLNVYQTKAFAGNDTIAAANQPIQLQATGGVVYQWTPASGLNRTDIANPVATLQKDATYIVSAATPVGCATVDSITIKIYKGPAFYVPSAFSPNNDGKNDQLKFLAVGMSSVQVFNVFNRYGQLVFTSNNPSKGWDGRINGVLQDTGAYVWMIKGVDFTGKPVSGKGTVVLIK